MKSDNASKVNRLALNLELLKRRWKNSAGTIVKWGNILAILLITGVTGWAILLTYAPWHFDVYVDMLDVLFYLAFVALGTVLMHGVSGITEKVVLLVFIYASITRIGNVSDYYSSIDLLLPIASGLIYLGMKFYNVALEKTITKKKTQMRTIVGDFDYLLWAAAVLINPGSDNAGFSTVVWFAALVFMLISVGMTTQLYKKGYLVFNGVMAGILFLTWMFAETTEAKFIVSVTINSYVIMRVFLVDTQLVKYVEPEASPLDGDPRLPH